MLRQNRLLRHSLFWLVIFATYIPVGMLDGDSIPVILLMNTCIHIPQMLAAYFFAYLVIPRFVFRKRYALAILLGIAALYLFPMLARLLTVHVGEELVRKRPFLQESVYEIMTDFGKLIFNYVPVVYIVSFQFLFVKYFLEYKRSIEREMRLSKQKTEAELRTLKAQLHPHFLFNTLNNIYSLSLDQSPKTPVAIGKLSEMLDYVLYQCNEPKVRLSGEVNLLANYIALETLRYDDRLEVNFNADISREIELPPLVLLSLVENAFKHGAGEDSGSPKIWIDIQSHADGFKAVIANTISAGYSVNTHGGIGLANIRQQLELVYAEDHTLEIAVLAKKFEVTLTIRT